MTRLISQANEQRVQRASPAEFRADNNNHRAGPSSRLALKSLIDIDERRAKKASDAPSYASDGVIDTRSLSQGKAGKAGKFAIGKRKTRRTRRTIFAGRIDLPVSGLRQLHECRIANSVRRRRMLHYSATWLADAISTRVTRRNPDKRAA